jgi:hypothetical protein
MWFVHIFLLLLIKLHRSWSILLIVLYSTSLNINGSSCLLYISIGSIYVLCAIWMEIHGFIQRFVSILVLECDVMHAVTFARFWWLTYLCSKSWCLLTIVIVHLIIAELASPIALDVRVLLRWIIISCSRIDGSMSWLILTMCYSTRVNQGDTWTCMNSITLQASLSGSSASGMMRHIFHLPC